MAGLGVDDSLLVQYGPASRGYLPYAKADFYSATVECRAVTDEASPGEFLEDGYFSVGEFGRG
jgi:hypothetical protein